MDRRPGVPEMDILRGRHPRLGRIRVVYCIGADLRGAAFIEVCVLTGPPRLSATGFRIPLHDLEAIEGLDGRRHWGAAAQVRPSPRGSAVTVPGGP